MSRAIGSETERRRSFAIISHPDAGKTTLTEKLLLYSGAIEQAGAVRARAGRQRDVTSDWMDLERQRGISITSTVLQFEYEDLVFNLLDTPGHRDFSEDTYRVLSAVDTAVIVLDAAKGIEEQTLKLFQVAQARGIPLITFVNKLDRPGLSPLAIIDDIEGQLDIEATPVTWPIGNGTEFEGVADRRDGSLWRFERTPGGGRIGEEDHLPEGWTANTPARSQALQELELLDAVGTEHVQKRFLAGEATPVFFGSALWNFGVRLLLDAVAQNAPAPEPRPDVDGQPRPLDNDVRGIRLQDAGEPRRPPSRPHRLHKGLLGSLRARGVTLVNHRTGRSLSTKHAHQLFGRDRQTVDIAYPGDVVGLVNAADLQIGDTLSADGKVRFPSIPTFAPEHFRIARNLNTSRYKQFRKGVAQLDQEGVIQALHTVDGGEREPILAAVGELQFDVAFHRLSDEFGAEPKFEPAPFQLARRTDQQGRDVLAGRRGVEIASRRDGTLLALFKSQAWLDAARRDHPDLTLDTIVQV